MLDSSVMELNHSPFVLFFLHKKGKKNTHLDTTWTLSSWHGYLVVKSSVSKAALLPSTHAVTTSAWPGDTPWVNKWGACQSAHHNSSETVVSREDLVMLGFGFFQLCCCLHRPGQITLRWLCHTRLFWYGERNWPALKRALFLGGGAVS